MSSMNTLSAVLGLALVSSLSAQRAGSSEHEEVRPRRPVDVSVEGLREAPRRAPRDSAAGRSTGVAARRLRLDCLESIADRATGVCLTASSTPTHGMLYPYPGLDNVFVPQAFVGGGEDNQATGPWSTVGGGKLNRATEPYATVGGGLYNTASGPGLRGYGGHTTVGGGKSNRASGAYSTVGGGIQNIASGDTATIGGGLFNAALRGRATVGGGLANHASGGYTAVAGGAYNTASGYHATVGGGQRNVASGRGATVPGGHGNAAAGDHSLAAGRRAKADHAGSFVWGDGFDGDKASSAPDEFNVYASGGVRMFTNSAATTGAALAPGSGTWSMLSDRGTKENVEPVDARAVLDKVAELPVATWNYETQDDFVRHMGPMAQDFRAAFGLGVSDKLIDTIDADGVALAAIQGLKAELEERLAEKDAEIEELRRRLERLETRATGE